MSAGYAGRTRFGKRALDKARGYAFLVDLIIVAIAVSVFLSLAYVPWWIQKSGDYPLTRDQFNFQIIGWFVLADCLYSSIFESSAWQSTPGKRLFQLRGAGLDGKKVSFLRAVYRYFLKIFAALFCSIVVVLADGFVVGFGRPYFHDVKSKTRVLEIKVGRPLCVSSRN